MNDLDELNTAEIIFMVYALGFALEKVAAMQEHGLHGSTFACLLQLVSSLQLPVYFKGTWNGFDLAFVTTYLIYAVLRLYGIYHDSE